MQGFVYRKNNKYLKYRLRTTHTGDHRDVDWIDDVNCATVFYNNVGLITRLEMERITVGAERVIAVETRTVRLPKLETKHGLVYQDGELLGCLQADQVAYALDLRCAEHLVEKLEKQND